jgi:hypothetical protein
MLGFGIGIPFLRVIDGGVIVIFQWGTSTPTKVWGTATTEIWG